MKYNIIISEKHPGPICILHIIIGSCTQYKILSHRFIYIFIYTYVCVQLHMKVCTYMYVYQIQYMVTINFMLYD